MRDLKKDIAVALEFLKHNYSARGKNHYDMIYGMTNERLDLYFKYFPIKDSNVLTVLGSGDFVLQSACEGAKKIYAFDYNPLALYMARLKIISMSSLKWNDFRNFFYNENYQGYYNTKYYKKVREYLDEDTRLFWDEIYSNVRSESEITNNLIMIDSLNKSISGFLNEDKYYLTRENLKDISVNYYCSDVFDVLSKIPNDIKFNVVFLSNIFDWMRLEDAVRYPLFIKRDLYKYLNNKGMVAVHSSVNGNISNVLNIIFEDVINVGKRDKVIVYKK